LSFLRNMKKNYQGEEDGGIERNESGTNRKNISNEGQNKKKNLFTVAEGRKTCQDKGKASGIRWGGIMKGGGRPDPGDRRWALI